MDRQREWFTGYAPLPEDRSKKALAEAVRLYFANRSSLMPKPPESKQETWRDRPALFS